MTMSTASRSTPLVVVLEMRRHFMANYNYLVVDPISREAVIVDPAWQPEKIDQALADTRARLRGILITHSHPDHVDLAKPLARRHECPIWMSKAEVAASGFDAPQLRVLDERPWSVGQMLIEPLFTPGHTPGCVCYLIEDNVFTGDVLFAEGCGACLDVPAAHDMFASLQALKARLPPHTRVFPGHSYGKPPGQRMSQLLRDNLYLQFANPHSFAAFRLRSGQDLLKMFTFS